MAFSKSPTQDTYDTVEFPIFNDLNTRGFPGTAGTSDYVKDTRLVNLIVDGRINKITGDKEISFVKRCGTKAAISGITKRIVGLYWWASASSEGRLIVLAKDADTTPADIDIFSYDQPADTTDGEWVLNTTYDKALPAGYTLNSTTGVENYKVSFAEFQYDSGAVDLVISDEVGGTLVKINQAGTLATCGDADFPDGLIGIQFVDGYLVGAKPGTADLYNSNLNDPFLWTAGDFITAEQYGDPILAVAKHHNYIVAFGQNSIEFLYDAAVTSGSPFQRNVSYSKQIGYVRGLHVFGDLIYFLGHTEKGSIDLFVIKDSEVHAVGGSLVQQFMAQYFYGTSAAYTLNSLYTSIVNCPKTGHNFYLMSQATAITYALNLTNLTWSVWGYTGGGSFSVEFAQSFQAASPLRHFSVVAGPSVTGLVAFDANLYRDSGSTFLIDLQTDSQDFGTMNQKYMHRLCLYTDKPTATVSISVEYTDNDYQTWETARTIDLYQELPSMNRLGRFRRRAIRLSGSFNDDFTLYKIEVDINKGGH